MSGRSTTYAIYILKQTIEKHREWQKRVIPIDLEKAYDREEIWRCSMERNVPEMYVGIVQDMYKGEGSQKLYNSSLKL